MKGKQEIGNMKTIVMTIVVSALLTLAVAVAFIYSGVYDVSASTQHSAVSNWAMATTMRFSVARRAKGLDVPDLSDKALQLAGVNDFEAMCVGCHGAPGKQPGSTGQGLNPAAPDLQQIASERTPAELFWVTKHGIRMTGMPAWGATHDDDALWPVVALMTALPDLDATTYQNLLGRAEGQGHHADGAPNDNRATHSDAEPEHDHHEH